MGPLWRMRRTGQGEDVVGADPRGEPREGRVGHEAAGRRIAADQPGRDAIGCRIGQGRPARRPSRRCRAGPRGPPRRRPGSAPLPWRRRPRPTSPGSVRRACRGSSRGRGLTDSSDGSLDHLRDQRVRDSRRIEQHERRRPEPVVRQVPPRSSRPSCGRRSGLRARPGPTPGSRRPRRRRCRGSHRGLANVRSGRAPPDRPRRPAGPRPPRQARPATEIRAEAATPWMSTSGRPAGSPHVSAENGMPAAVVVKRGSACQVGALERCRDGRRQVGRGRDDRLGKGRGHRADRITGRRRIGVPGTRR